MATSANRADDGTVVAALVDLLGADRVVADADVIAGRVIDWTGRFQGSSPAVVRPVSTDEVAELVAWCRRTGTAIVPQGGNTGLVGGATPMRGEIVLSTERLGAIGELNADAGELTAGAGATVAAVQDAARSLGWRYGVDLASRDSATIGGTVATNAGGLRVLRHGATRHQLLGVEAVLGTGATIRRLRGLRKDNTGLDLAGLLCGSEGTLGVVTAARLGLVAPAGATVTALVGFGSVGEAIAAVGAARRAVPTLEAAELVLADGARLVHDQTGVAPVFDPIPAVLVVLEAVGPPDPTDRLAEAVARAAGVVDVAVATDPERAAALWHVREAHTDSIGRVGVPHKFDVTLPGAELARFVSEVPTVVAAAAAGSRTWMFGHVGDGNVHVNVTDVADRDTAAVEDAVLGEVVARGGSISAEHGIGIAKRSWLVRDRGRSDVDAMRAVKHALDPDGVLNPNVLLP